MNKYFRCAMALVIVGTAACSKKSDSTNNTNAVSSTSSTWMLNGTTYTSATVSVLGNTITAISAPADTEEIAFFFRGNTLPTDTGTYKVVVTSVTSLTTADSNAKKVIVLATNTKTNVGYTVLSGTVAVTINGGKMTAMLAPTTDSNLYSTGGHDTMRISATIVQP